jgi:hypothetical protein
MLGPSRDDYGEASSDRGPKAIENRLTGPLLHAKELVELVHFSPDLFLGLELSPETSSKNGVERITGTAHASGAWCWHLSQ